MSDMESGSDRLSHRWRNFLFPEPLDLILYSFIAIFLLVLMNIVSLWDYISQNLIGGDSSAVVSSLPKISRVNDLISAHGRVTVALFWAAIGFVVYLLFWVIYSLIIGVRNDVVASHFVRPSGGRGLGYWKSVFNYKGELVLVMILSVLFIFCCFKLVPVFSQLFLVSLLRFSKSSVINLVASIIGLTLLIHIANVLRRFLMDAWGRQIF